MDKQKRIEEMAKVIHKADENCVSCFPISMSECLSKHGRFRLNAAIELYNAGYRKQSVGEWIYHECVSSYDGIKSGYCCSRCNAFVDEDVFDADEFHKVYCGNCGAKMKGE